MSFPKPSRTERRLSRRSALKAAVQREKDEKAKARRRDRVCRFPLCGCRKAGLPLEVAHIEHKGMGSRLGRQAVNVAANFILLCEHRHQHGAVSMHHGTLKIAPLTERGCDGPVAFILGDTVIREDQPLEDHDRRLLLELAKLQA